MSSAANRWKNLGTQVKTTTPRKGATGDDEESEEPAVRQKSKTVLRAKLNLKYFGQSKNRTRRSTAHPGTTDKTYNSVVQEIVEYNMLRELKPLMYEGSLVPNSNSILWWQTGCATLSLYCAIATPTVVGFELEQHIGNRSFHCGLAPHHQRYCERTFFPPQAGLRSTSSSMCSSFSSSAVSSSRPSKGLTAA
jgi:hypothetical protein